MSIGTCHEHTGIVAKMEILEQSTKILFRKWDSMQKVLISTLISTVLSLIGVVFLMIR